jgi:hypothetical protein
MFELESFFNGLRLGWALGVLLGTFFKTPFITANSISIYLFTTSTACPNIQRVEMVSAENHSKGLG